LCATDTIEGLIWDNLTVKGIGGVKNFVKVFPDAFVSFFNVPGTIMSLFGLGSKGREFNILQGFRGVAKPGEMVLVLGRPGSGCTTFLKVISNQRFGYTAVDGEVLYGSFDAQTFAKKYIEARQSIIRKTMFIILRSQSARLLALPSTQRHRRRGRTA
jgi:ATP-binding cassette, subfamily G (WHITE), member 2, SNQ2